MYYVVNSFSTSNKAIIFLKKSLSFGIHSVTREEDKNKKILVNLREDSVTYLK